MTKPTVKFHLQGKGFVFQMQNLVKGDNAIIFPIDHPSSFVSNDNLQ